MDELTAAYRDQMPRPHRQAVARSTIELASEPTLCGVERQRDMRSDPLILVVTVDD